MTHPRRLLASSLPLILSLLSLPGCSDDEPAEQPTGRGTGASGGGGGGGSGGGPIDPNTYADPEAVAVRLRDTLDDLAEFGEKHAGAPAGAQAGEYVKKRFEAAGLKIIQRNAA